MDRSAEIDPRSLTTNPTEHQDDFLDSLRIVFVKKDLAQYSCEELNEYIHDENSKLTGLKLKKVDSVTCQRLFQGYTNEYGSFCDSYWFSLDRPIHSFTPVTVVQTLGVAERPLIMLLFDRHGRIVNSVEVANSYGEGGGCLSSSLVKDSILIRNYEWTEYSEDTVYSKFLTDQVVISITGRINETELKRWESVRPY